MGAVAAGLAAGVAAVTLVPLHGRVQHWAEHRFRRPLVRLRRGLPLVGDLRQTAGVAAIADTALARVAEGVRATAGAVVLTADPLAGALTVAQARAATAPERRAETQALSTRVAKLEMMLARLATGDAPGHAAG